jgi:transcriptional regulator with XRE-family HTH domain
MTTLAAPRLRWPTVYDDALLGEPLPCRVQPQILGRRGQFLIVGTWPITLPAVEIAPARDVQRMVSALRASTGWSARRLAEALGTSHTTVRAVESGRPIVAGHSGNLRQRITAAHDVVSRIFVIAGRDSTLTARAFEDAPQGGDAAINYLRRGDAARAYIAALDVLRPRTPGLLVGSRPRREGATAPLHD